MAKQQFNDRTNPQTVMISFLVPRQIHVAVARAFHFRPSPALAVFLNRATMEFEIEKVPL